MITGGKEVNLTVFIDQLNVAFVAVNIPFYINHIGFLVAFWCSPIDETKWDFLQLSPIHVDIMIVIVIT